MSLTLLLDLDDTLLDTNMGEFIPAYFQALSRHLARWVGADAMLPALMSGTQLMLDNLDPTRTLQEVFDGHFYPKVAVDQEQLRQAVEDFYDNAFHLLATVTRRREGAVQLVDWALAQGYRVAIATDPLFPRKAVYERIRWSGLDPESFELVSSYETFHFTKTHPEFYAEFMGRLGWPDGPVLMVGNDEERDLARAREFGIRTYQVHGIAEGVREVAGAADRASAVVGRGTLADLRVWLESADLATLEPSFKERRAVLAILRSTPAVLGSLTAQLGPEAWKHEPSPEDWAMIEIVSHLRDTEREVHHDQLRVLMNEAQPFVPRPDAAVWAKQRNYLHEDGSQAIADFAAARMETLRILQTVSPEVWERSARHAIFGPTHFMEVLGFMADHDRLHIQQAWQTLRVSG